MVRGRVAGGWEENKSRRWQVRICPFSIQCFYVSLCVCVGARGCALFTCKELCLCACAQVGPTPCTGTQIEARIPAVPPDTRM